ncbi:MAG: glycolate oxidase subunit GlcF [Rhodospirillales bacterium]|jgi:glycolate oxidase iron-sulfur subunit|nr:glycolate oxidase subunit GlcF [Rhodospirillales bacterium]
MQTHFTKTQLESSTIIEADSILRRCVHCGFCTATCPTYILLGDELDSPRGRIFLIRDMLESDAPPKPDVIKHLDRCLTCLSCTTTCPSGVDYMHLIDIARGVIEQRATRPIFERWFRSLLAILIPRPGLFRLALTGAWLARPFKGFMPGKLKTMVSLAPETIKPASPMDRPHVFKAEGEKRMRVTLMTGCAQKVLRPSINESTIRLLTRHGCEVVIAKDAGCCGALEHHMGKLEGSHGAAKRNIAAWEAAEKSGGAIDAVVINASGCGTTLKDYGHMLKGDPVWAERAATIAERSKDITEIIAKLGLNPVEHPPAKDMKVAYHSACSMQHGQKITQGPKTLLELAGFEVSSPAEGHLCCGSAGTYNMTQPELATQLGERKAGNLKNTGADIVSTGNIGCLMQIGNHGDMPVVHTAELLDWATGGPKPDGLE